MRSDENQKPLDRAKVPRAKDLMHADYTAEGAEPSRTTTKDNEKVREIRKLLSRAASARYESDLATAEARYHQALRRAGRRYLKGFAHAQREAIR